MNNDKTGGPAFPVPNDANLNEQEGMTLRDYFAGQALTGAISACVEAAKAAQDVAEGDEKVIAAFAYEIADAMLAARDKGEG